jgi:hypothetical protein
VSALTPTRWHYFFAHNWPGRLWITLVPLLCVVLMAWALGPAPPELSRFGPDANRYLMLLEVNGGPFQPGDRVRILVGRYRGHIATVIEVWEWRGDLRVDLGARATSKRPTAVFGLPQVIKVTEADG